MKNKTNKHDKVTSSSRQIILEAEGVTKTVRDGSISILVLNKLDLVIRSGELISIVAPSGRGKSILLNCLTGISSIDDGRILFNEENIELLSESEVHTMRTKDMGIIADGFDLISVLNVEENLMTQLLVGGYTHREAKSLVSDVLDKADLKNLSDKMPSELSKLEKQKFVFIRAILHGPKIILADEVTSSLDKKDTDLLIDFIKELHKEYKSISIVIFTHDVNVGIKTQKIYKLDAGKLI